MNAISKPGIKLLGTLERGAQAESSARPMYPPLLAYSDTNEVRFPHASVPGAATPDQGKYILQSPLALAMQAHQPSHEQCPGGLRLRLISSRAAHL
jgi:hypothetical protein